MPAYFTSKTPMKFVDFNYDAYFNYLEKTFGRLSFFSNWKRFWIDIFRYQDQQIIEFINKYPGSNPAIERMKRPGVPVGFSYEIFTYEFSTAGGSIYLTFDVEKMKYVQHHKNVTIPIEEIPIEDIDVDPTTPIVRDKFKDQRLPFLTIMYGNNKPFICVDGNKRIQYRKENSKIEKVKGYLFNENHWEYMFFLDYDQYYMWFTREQQYMYYLQKINSTEQEIFEATQMYLQTND
ncbi:hypothetical protein QFZ28_003265 [Neobacillus niacini]|uniref:hypothetical protein n=1 Tax=Neobacillus niacini TaxID=86668 RepID=UPI002781D3F1|nr:hypothetical protein [Neobacillus niacini]MDQ1002865.1 hypothetical protein [Neobacillus niacini]